MKEKKPLTIALRFPALVTAQNVEVTTRPHMKEEMQGFHMSPSADIFVGLKALFSGLSQSKCRAPGICIKEVVASGSKVVVISEN